MMKPVHLSMRGFLNQITETDRQTDSFRTREYLRLTEKQTGKKRQTKRETDKKTVRQTDRQVSRETDRQNRQRQRERQIDRDRERTVYSISQRTKMILFLQVVP